MTITAHSLPLFYFYTLSAASILQQSTDYFYLYHSFSLSNLSVLQLVIKRKYTIKTEKTSFMKKRSQKFQIYATNDVWAIFPWARVVFTLGLPRSILVLVSFYIQTAVLQGFVVHPWLILCLYDLIHMNQSVDVCIIGYSRSPVKSC